MEKRKVSITSVAPILNKSSLSRKIAKLLDQLLGVKRIYQIFEKSQGRSAGDTFANVLHAVDIKIDSADLIQKIPRTGGCIVIANHPFGGSDAISLCALCMRVRPDAKVIANALTSSLPGIDQATIPMEIMGEGTAIEANTNSMKESIRHLRSGGLLVVFPAGAVSHWSWKQARVIDPPWSEHTARLAMKLKTPVLPVKYFGQNPAWYHLLGSISPLMRSALIVRVFLFSRGQTIRCCAGNMIPPEKIAKQGDATELSDYLRQKVEDIHDL